MFREDVPGLVEGLDDSSMSWSAFTFDSTLARSIQSYHFHIFQFQSFVITVGILSAALSLSNSWWVALSK